MSGLQHQTVRHGTRISQEPEFEYRYRKYYYKQSLFKYLFHIMFYILLKNKPQNKLQDDHQVHSGKWRSSCKLLTSKF